MAVEEIIRHIPAIVFLFLQGLNQILAEDCGNGIHCFAPYECCTNLKQCCYDRSSDDSFHRAYKLHVWNMWYFWFIIIFIMMSCFGGCGYYRRRRMAAVYQHNQRSAISVRRSSNQRGPSRNTQSYLAYVGPAASEPPGLAFLPPPYSEVMSHPGTYPSNKEDLPPYPGPPVIAASNYADTVPPSQDLMAGATGLPRPPPYSEVAATSLAEASRAGASQGTDRSQSARQDTGSQAQ